MKRSILATLFLLSFASTASAQTQAGASDKLAWDQAASNLAEAQAFVFKAIVDGAATPVTVTAACAGASSPFTCQTPLPSVAVGNHTVSLTASTLLTDGTLITSAASTTFSYHVIGPPAPPSNLRLIRVIAAILSSLGAIGLAFLFHN